MSNSNKLKDDIKRHNGTAWAKAWLEESENELKVDIKVKLNNPIDFIITNIALDSITAADGCPHTSKRKEGISTLFYVCNKCGKDLGNV